MPKSAAFFFPGVAGWEWPQLHPAEVEKPKRDRPFRTEPIVCIVDIGIKGRMKLAFGERDRAFEMDEMEMHIRGHENKE